MLFKRHCRALGGPALLHARIWRAGYTAITRLPYITPTSSVVVTVVYNLVKEGPIRTFPWDTLIVFFVSMAVIFSLRFLWYACWGLNRAPRPILSKNIQKRLLVYLCEKREDCGCSTSPQVDIIDLGNDQAFCEQIQSILHQARYRGTLYTKSPVVYGGRKVR